MSRFRKIVEEQLSKTPKSYKFLTEDLKAAVLTAVHKMEIEEEELPSYTYTPAQTWGYVHNPEPAEYDWDEEEEFSAKIDKFINYVEADGIIEYVDGIPQEKWDDTAYLNGLTEEAFEWLESIR